MEEQMVKESMRQIGYLAKGSWEYPLPNGKKLERMDFAMSPCHITGYFGEGILGCFAAEVILSQN